ncbi:MAG TPA: class I SAM-dependent methyltransferase [Chthoniobacterales bacterium]|nr:class I SAM-dependent methyltransferase [Chthoniobacterales bacterium]
MDPREHDIMRSVEDHYWWYQALRQHVAESIVPATPSFSLLDAGCGTGGMLRVVREKFPLADLAGVDQSAHAVELAAGRETGARLVSASVHELPFPKDSFDFVLSLDVLSHAGVDEALALHETHRVLSPGGRLILNLAAFDFLKGAHDSAVDVDRRYTQRQLRGFLAGSGFQVERLSYWNATFAPPIALLRWLSRARAPIDRPRSDFRPLPPFVNSILKRVAGLELNASRHVSLPFGTSLFAVARKNG